jgi:hypothetical protein
MSEKNSLKELYRTAQTTADLDLFLYTGLPIVGRDGLVSIVADITFDRLVQTCKKQKELAVEMLEPSVLMMHINKMKDDFVAYILGCSEQDKLLGITYVSELWRTYFYENMAYSNTATGNVSERLFFLEAVDYPYCFNIYRFGENDVNSFILCDSESIELLQHTLDFINSN